MTLEAGLIIALLYIWAVGVFTFVVFFKKASKDRSQWKLEAFICFTWPISVPILALMGVGEEDD